METPNPLEKYKDLLPSKSELACRSLFAGTEEERQAAKRLSDIVPEGKDEEHPLLTLKRLHPEGSVAAKLADETLVGKSICELCAALPEELIDAEELLEEFMELLDQNQPDAPAANKAPDIKPEPRAPDPMDDLAYRLRMRQAQARNEPGQGKWSAAKPPEPNRSAWDDRLPLDF
jgi:DNA-directed RNA polymerase subunit F